MIDQNSQFQAILTAVGEAKQANADALGIPWTFAQMGVGDANGTDPFPDRLQTKLINERRRAPLNQLKPDPKNPGIIIAEQVIPENVGGFWIREIGLYDKDGDLVAVANCAPTFKPLLAQGSGRTQIIRMNLIVSSIANIVLKIDPSVVLATREYVGQALETILPGNKAPGTYRRVTINKYGIVQSGDNPTTLAGYGITDALRVGVVSSQRPILSGSLPAGEDNNVGGMGGAISIREVNEVGTAKSELDWAPSIHFHWFNRFARYLKMSALGDLVWGNKRVWTEWNFDPGLKANKTEVDTALAAKANKATTLAGYEIGDAFTKAQANAAIAAAIAGLVNSAPGALDTLKELSDALGGDPNFATTVLNKLGLKADILTSLRVGSVSRQRPVLSGNVAASGDGGVDGMGGAIELREINEVGGAQSDLKWAPAILFHWSGKFSRYLKMSVLGDLIWGDKKIWTEGNFNPATKANSVDVTNALELKANIVDVLASAYMMPNGRLMVPTSNGTLYIQWYEGPQADAETVNYPVVSHPVPFPVQCLWAGVFTQSTTGNQLSDQMFQMEYWGRQGVKVFPQWFGTGSQGLIKPLIIAIGR
ncbi:phage tail protein [Pseudomonas proteolytica]|uniref:phage tail protein n=1 Tax=Pseudomonas proteolytica TaxID=219574 RepID=UPI0023DF4D2D|nr:phage tail protein [Pseudomonas proteolytica]MDF3162843.1 phage tail protein [Pseudomonas proteolytica]